MGNSGDRSLSDTVVKLAGGDIEVVKLPSGILVDKKLRVGGMLFIEEQFGKPFEQVADEMDLGDKDAPVSISVMVKKIGPFLKALIHQRQPDLSGEELDAILNDLELEEFTRLFDQVSLFSERKNAPGPAAPKKRTRQPVKPKRTK